MLVTKQLKRIFLMKEKDQEIKLADPKTSYSPEAVLNFYTATYPELVTAKIVGPTINNDRVEFRFISTVGTKG